MRHFQYSVAIRPATAASRRGNAAKVILITLAVICVIGFLACTGAGVAVYLAIQRNLTSSANSVVLFELDSTRIRRVTAEILDITLPPEFVPRHAHSIFGFTSVTYRWCPTGTCPEDESSLLMLSTKAGNAEGMQSPDGSQLHSDESLKARFTDFTKEERELEIRGQKYKFVFVLGKMRSNTGEDEIDDNELLTKPPITTARDPSLDASLRESNPAIATTIEVTEQKPADGEVDLTPVANGPKVCWIHGQFPGKQGTCDMDLQLTQDQYDEEKILSMIQSIR